MKSKSLDETKALKEYWENVRLQWTETNYEKSTVYRTCKNRLLNMLDGVRNSLEIGFGDGRWIKFLKNQGVNAWGIDILENAAIRLKHEGFSPVVADARQLPFKENLFDLTYSFGVVEHFESTEKAVEEHIRVTKRGGRIVITVPYLFSPYTGYWILRHIKEGTFKERPVTFGKRYTKKGFRTILGQFDVRIRRVDSFSCPIPKLKFYRENSLLEKFGVMIWAEMIKK